MLLSYVIVDFYLFYDGVVDISIPISFFALDMHLIAHSCDKHTIHYIKIIKTFLKIAGQFKWKRNENFSHIGVSSH